MNIQKGSNGFVSNPVLGTSKKQPAPRAGFTILGPDRGRNGATNRKHKFLDMQYRPAKIYPESLDLSVRKWYVFYWFMHPLTGKYERKKVYEDINLYKGEGKVEYAKNLRDAVNLALRNGYSPFDEEEKIELWIQETEKQAAAEAAGDLTNITMIQALNLFFAAKKEQGLVEKSLSSYSTTANIVKNGLNENGMLLTPAKNIAGKQFMTILKDESTKANWENKTYNNYVLYLQTILNWLANETPEKQSIIPKNPIKGAELRKVLSRKHTVFSDDQLKDLLKLVRDEKDIFMEGIILTSYYAAVRAKEELRNFRIGNILFDRDLLRLDAEGTKAGEDQFIPLDPELKKWFISQGYDKLPKDWFVFGNKRQPGPIMAATNFYSRLFLENYKKTTAIGLTDDHTIYGLKHTRAIHLVMAKVDIYAIMILFRHKDLEQTMIYLRDLGLMINTEAVENSRKI